MGLELGIFGDQQLNADYLDWLVNEQSVAIQKHFSRLWDYYSNPMVEAAGGRPQDRKVSASGRCYVQAQEYGIGAVENRPETAFMRCARRVPVHRRANECTVTHGVWQH